MAETHHPLRIACKNCGSPVGFDIVRQTYRCVHCGELSGIQEVKDLYDHPLLYEILPNGKKVTMFSMIKEMGAVGVVLFGAVLVILLVSTSVILM